MTESLVSDKKSQWIMCVFIACLMLLVPLSGRGRVEPALTRHELSAGLQVDDSVYFLSSYYLYLPGKTIIPMYAATPQKIIFEELSLYELKMHENPDAVELQRLWRYDGDGTNRSNTANVKLAVSDNRLYFRWLPVPSHYKTSPADRVILEYDIETQKARLVAQEELPEAVVPEYHPPQRISPAQIRLHGARMPFAAWDLPSVLEYLDASPRDLKKHLLNRQGDRHFRVAALVRLDALEDSRLMMGLWDDIAGLQDGMYRQEMQTRIQMSDTLREEQESPIFTAVWENNAAELERLLDMGVDPDTCDENGVSLLRYALYANASDSLRLLFEYGADPLKDKGPPLAVWSYASGSSLRPLYLELTQH